MSVIFDGHDIGLICTCGDPKLTILSSSVNYAESSNRNGAIVRGRTWGTSAVEFTVAFNGTKEECRNAMSTLGMWLDVDESKKLVLPDTPDRYYMAIPDGDLSLTRGFGGEYGTLKFTLTDPIAYGRVVSVDVPSEGSVSFIVGGTAPTYPTIESSTVTPDGTSKLWGLRLDGGEFFHIGNGGSSDITITADFRQRTSTIAGVLHLPTLDSDWFALTPGEDAVHTLANDIGSGAVTVKYQERWL